MIEIIDILEVYLEQLKYKKHSGQGIFPLKRGYFKIFSYHQQCPASPSDLMTIPKILVKTHNNHEIEINFKEDHKITLERKVGINEWGKWYSNEIKIVKINLTHPNSLEKLKRTLNF